MSKFTSSITICQLEVFHRAFTRTEVLAGVYAFSCRCSSSKIIMNSLFFFEALKSFRKGILNMRVLFAVLFELAQKVR